jgi:FdhD protein
MSNTAESYLDGVAEFDVQTWQNGSLSDQHDRLAVETPIALVFNGISHVVMMATPSDLEDFALGFGMTEGLFESAKDLYGVEQINTAEGIELALEVSSACEWRLKERRRTLAGRTGCGLCGADSLNQIQRPLNKVPVINIEGTAVIRAQNDIRQWQTLGKQTGATHAAAWVDVSGKILRIREDVGRHNALDKLIGSLLREQIDPQSGFICITSRASFEMVQKAVLFGASVLAAISAPTAMAVDLARKSNLALAAYVRDEKFVAYSFPERFLTLNSEV